MDTRHRTRDSFNGRGGILPPVAAGTWEALNTSADLKKFSRAWLSLLCEQVREEVHTGLLLLEADGAFVPAALWPAEQADVTHLAVAAQQCLSERRQIVQRDSTGAGLIVAYPFESGGHLLGVVVLDLRQGTDEILLRVVRLLRWGGGWLESLFVRGRWQDDAKRLGRTQAALDLLAVAAEQSGLPELGLAVANDLASRFACDRVAFGIDRQGRACLVALSHSAFFEKKSQFVAALENAMDEALDQRRSVRWPPPEDDARTTGVAIAHRDFAAHRAVCSVLISSRGRGIGVLTFERNQGAAFSADELRGFEAIGALLGPLVESRSELHRWVAGRAADEARRLWYHLKDPRRPAFRVGMALAVIALLAVLLIDGEYRVSAKSVVEGEVQRSVVAPFAGFIREAPVRAGMLVSKGQVLARLDDRDLLLDRQRWMAEREQHERRYRDALARHERAASQVSLAQMAEVQSQLALVEEKLARAEVVAPFDGVVVTGDLTQLLGSPVDQGKLLFEVAPLDAYRVILKVDDRDIRHVHTSQPGRLVLAGLSGEALDFKVVNISMAQAEEGKNLFRVEAKLDHSEIPLRPGMEGVGKISVGERSYAWIWTHRLFDWLRLQAWTWLP